MSQPQATVNHTGTDTFPATSLWLDRTQWPSIYQGSRRDVLQALTRLPNRHSLNADYVLGQGTLQGAPNLISPREDEQKISCIMRALDSVIDRCEDTVRGTSHNLLCWLLSSRLQSRREFAFNLVVERSSEIRYRRTQKQFLAFVLRMYGMPGDARREMVNVKIKPGMIAQLDRIWEHNIWNYFDLSKGTWPVVERQGSPLAGTYSSVMGGRSIDGSLNNRASQGSDAKEGAEDGEIDDENVEAWELDDDDDDEDGESDYGDSGYYNDFNEYTAGTHQDIFSRISGGSAVSAFDQFLELLFQLCVMLKLKSNQAKQKIRTPIELSSTLYGAVRGWVSHEALRKVEQQRKLLLHEGSAPLSTCTGSFSRSQGLPCAHKLKGLLVRDQALQIQWQPITTLENFEFEPELTCQDLPCQLTIETEQVDRHITTPEPRHLSPAPSMYTPPVSSQLTSGDPASDPTTHLRYDDPRAIHQRYVKSREDWYKAQPPGTWLGNRQYRKAMGLPLGYPKASYSWCLDYKQMGRCCKTSTGLREWTKEEMMAYLDWDKAETNRIEARVAEETENGRLFTSRRGMGELWEMAQRDIDEQKALYSAAEQEESCIVVQP
ncbi:hypothetical protein FOTG_17456 [Fusarium oxysporum f. sp. vasinfectum 25433]|uniref:Uncharacterized protein n=1 Tax=Fusarium oxysporum f. sp. vasinfectum 25433 TaxID=1089449 RepID=X0KKQ1_FUSOX|nr:hypothetical protein FOTG_17456 [Fusarium oxysporum f. sp. vasinfectum 25433]